MTEAEIIPAARERVAARLVEARDASVGLAAHPEIAAAVAECESALKKLAAGLAATAPAAKIVP